MPTPPPRTTHTHNTLTPGLPAPRVVERGFPDLPGPQSIRSCRHMQPFHIRINATFKQTGETTTLSVNILSDVFCNMPSSANRSTIPPYAHDSLMSISARDCPKQAMHMQNARLACWLHFGQYVDPGRSMGAMVPGMGQVGVVP